MSLEPVKSKRKKLIESFTINGNQNVLLRENSEKKLFENADNTVSVSADTKNFSCYAIIKDVPVTKFTLNLNNRIYSKELWSKVQEKGSAERSWCHANHSDDDGDVTKYIGVWHNFRVLDDQGVCDLYVLDNENGRTLVAGLLAGGQVHFSTFGYGEMVYDEWGNETEYVDPNCYELARMGDWVAVSSQNVITTKEQNQVEIPKMENVYVSTPKQPFKYEIEEKNENLKENFEKSPTNSSTEHEGVLVMENNKLSETASISFVKNAVKSSLREAKNLAEEGKYNEALDLLTDVKVDIPEGEQFTDLREKVESSLNDIDSKKTKEFEEAKESAQTLSEKYQVATEALSALKEEHEKLKKVVEEMVAADEVDTNQLETAVAEISQNVDTLTSTLDAKDETIAELESEVVELQAQVASADSDTADVIAAAEEQITAMAQEIAEVVQENIDLQEKLSAHENKLTEEEDSEEEDEEEDSEEEESEEEEKKDEKKESRIAPRRHIRENVRPKSTDVEDYVELLLESKPELAEHKEHLLESRSTLSVKRKVKNLTTFKEDKASGDSGFKIPETVSYSAIDQVR